MKTNVFTLPAIFTTFAMILLLNLVLVEPVFATCSCIIDTREAINEKDPNKTIGNFSDTLHREYTYFGGGYAGPTVFDLSENEIKTTYKLMNKLSPSEYEVHRDNYISGIKLLKTSKVKNSGTYNSSKAQLIFKSDKKFQERINELSKNIERIKNLNSNNKNLLIVTIENLGDKKAGYIAYTGENGYIQANDVPTLAKEINKLTVINNSKIKTIYLDMKNFSPNKSEAFFTSYKIQQNQNNKKILVKKMERKGSNSTEQQDIFLKRNVDLKFVSASDVIFLKNGKYRGYYQGVVDVLHKTKMVSIKIISKTKEVVSDFAGKMKIFFQPTGNVVSINAQNSSIGDYINNIRIELIKKHNINEEDIIIQFKDQFGRIQIVVIDHHNVSA